MQAELQVLNGALREFLSQHLDTKLLDSDSKTLKLYIKHARTNKKSAKKDIIINFLLERYESKILENNSPEASDLQIGRFLVNEMRDFYRKTLPPV